ncbi:MAG: NADH-quinone oxidoreductase subunit NuoH [Chloroflexi bacterium]|nr:NADH-quinone oxidoreductase subunit NuoH [Chloroflexota bacterium]
MRARAGEAVVFGMIVAGLLGILGGLVLTVGALGSPERVTLEVLAQLATVLIVLFTLLAIAVLTLVWLERKQLARMQGRVGPTRVGPFGLLQPVADALKLVMKEDVAPGTSSKLLFFVAPLLVFVPGFVVWLTIPFARDVVVRSLDMGLFFFIAISVLSIVGLVLAGWSSGSKYAVLGGIRAAAQLISYEIPIIMTVLTVAMLADSMSFVVVVEAQRTVPYIVLQPLGFIVFFLAGLAEVGRTPFDVYSAESEIVGGPFVEYSGAHWAIFFLAEYVNTFVIGAVATLLFLGGWSWPFGEVPAAAGVALFLGKTYLVVMAIFWVRATYPRLRIDQLMSLGWKVLIPLSFAVVVATAVQLFYEWPRWTLPVMSLAVLAVPVVMQLRGGRRRALAEARRYAERAVVVEAKPRPQRPQEPLESGA